MINKTNSQGHGPASEPSEGESPPLQPSELPTLYEEIIDDEVLEALFVDVETLCELEELKIRPLPGASFKLPPADLTEARKRLILREVSSIQMRYCHEGTSWLDTITPTPVGFRLLRMAGPLLPE